MTLVVGYLLVLCFKTPTIVIHSVVHILTRTFNYHKLAQQGVLLSSVTCTCKTRELPCCSYIHLSSAGRYSNCSISIFVRQDIMVFNIIMILLISTERG